MAENRTAELLAGILDLAPAGVPPHPPGPCDALCVPICTGRGGEVGYRAPTTGAVLAGGVRPPTSPSGYATAT
jgi:hypothetical protein